MPFSDPSDEPSVSKACKEGKHEECSGSLCVCPCGHKKKKK
jgi:hypothetical protein